MSIQITTAKQKVEFSKMVKDYKIRYYNLGPSLLYVDYVDSTGTKTEIVPAYGSFTVISNAGNAANSYLNFYTSSGTTNIVVSKIQQDCAVDGTNLFGNLVTEIDPADITALQQEVTNLSNTVNEVSSDISGIETSITGINQDLQSVKVKTQNQSGSAGVTNFSGTTNLTNASVSGTMSVRGGFQADAGTKFWTINESGLIERSGENGLIQMLNGQITCDTISPKTINSDNLFSVTSGNVDCETLTAATKINIPNVVSFTSAGNNLYGKLNMSVKSDDSDVVNWYLDATEGIKFVEGQGGTGLQIGGSGISMPSCFKLMLGTETSGGGVVFYGPERIRLEGGVLFGPRTGLSSIDADGNATFVGCSASNLSALGKVSGNVFEGTASGYDYFEVSPGVCKLPSGNPQSGTYGYKHWFGTLAEYTALAEKDSTTFYHVVQEDKSVLTYYGK